MLKSLSFGPFFLDLPVLLLGLPLPLGSACVFFLLSPSVPNFLLLPALFTLGIPGDIGVIYPGLCPFQALRGLFHGERSVPDVSVNQGLPAELSLSMFEAETHRLGSVKKARHLLRK